MNFDKESKSRDFFFFGGGGGGGAGGGGGEGGSRMGGDRTGPKEKKISTRTI